MNYPDEWEGFTLRISFEGLCGFLPDEPFFVKDQGGKYKRGNPKKLSVLLPDARPPGIADWEMQLALAPVLNPFLRPSHAPLIALRAYDIADMDDFEIDGIVANPTTQELREIHILDNELITFETESVAAESWPKLTFCGDIPKNQSQPCPDNERLRRSLWWVPRLEEIASDFQWSDLSGGEPNTFPARKVAGRVDLPGGRLSVIELNSKGKIPWSFGAVTRDDQGYLHLPNPKDCSWNRALSAKVCCDIRVKAAAVNLVVEDDEGNVGTVTLRPSSGQSMVEVAVINGELEALALRGTEQWMAPGLPDVDFQTLYGLSYQRSKNAPAQSLPVPVPRGYSGLDAKPCASAVFSGPPPNVEDADSSESIRQEASNSSEPSPCENIDEICWKCCDLLSCDSTEFMACGLGAEGKIRVYGNVREAELTLEGAFSGFRLASTFEVPFNLGQAVPPQSASAYTAKAGTTLATGTLGCSLYPLNGEPDMYEYFLTAGHVLNPLKTEAPVARRHGKELGRVVHWLTVEDGLDWGLVEGAKKVTPSNNLNWDPDLTLRTPMKKEHLCWLLGKKIALSGAASKVRRCGTVVLVYACALVTARTATGYECYKVPNQIIVWDPTLLFGQDGDSGAVAYLTDSIGRYPPGTAIGLYWLKSLAQDLFVLTPMCDVLKSIHCKTGLELELR